MSDVIEDYIRRNPGLRESEAFDAFVGQDRIKQWVGTDASRRDRLRSEFGRVYGTMQLLHAPQPKAAAAAPQRLQVNVTPDQPARRLSLLCASCAKMDVWRAGDSIGCRSCGRGYDDMLDLIPVKAVGPFAFAFGEGWTGVAVAGGVALLLVGIYGVLRWL